MFRLLLIGLFLLFSSTQRLPVENAYLVQGRSSVNHDGSISLIGSASSVCFDFKGAECRIFLANHTGHHNYITVELDGRNLGRILIPASEKFTYTVPLANSATHCLRIFKATEAANGEIIFRGAEAKSVTRPKAPSKPRIEFIGDSITCGMANDLSDVGCGQGEWYDQHNAYLAYGPVLARNIGADFMLSSVSGIGMYRNWNDEHENEAIMPDVYEKLYLSRERPKLYDFSFKPEIVSICLGTNDISDGDGKKPRLAFDREKYVSNYIAFVKTIYRHSPNAQLVLLNSPMISGPKNEVLVACLKRVADAFATDQSHKPIVIFEFSKIDPKGCTSHPDISDHKAMAAQMEPLLKKLIHDH